MKYVPSIVLAYWSGCGLPVPATEHRFHPTRKWRFDFAFIGPQVAVEVEGGIWIGGSKQGQGSHARPIHFVKDMEKYNQAARLGWRVLRFQPKEICLQTTVDLIRETIGDHQ